MISISDALRADMLLQGIDPELTLALLHDWNAGFYADVQPVHATGLPQVDDMRVIALGKARAGKALAYPVRTRDAQDRLASVNIALPESVKRQGDYLIFDEAALDTIGMALLPRTAYGVLNGGSATSYADRKKNLTFGEGVFDALCKGFDAMSPLCMHKPKGLTPAYINPDGTPGASFLALKMRARLVAIKKLREAQKNAAAQAGHNAAGRNTPDTARNNAESPLLPLFQMSSTGNNAELAAYYAAIEDENFLGPLARATGQRAASWATGVQPLIAAWTHSSEGNPKHIFEHAYGEPLKTLPLPGGHGQCFRILTPVLRDLYAQGIRFACLGNVDNIAYFPDTSELALLLLSGKPAGFECSFRTPVDVKGGILVNTAQGMTIADIGPAISFEKVQALEAQGFPILFNCASGIFDLDWLLPRIDKLGRALPLRVTDQDKDAGRYSQAEQVAWEIAGILPDFLAFAVDKYERFIAAKLLTETLLTSGLAACDARIPADLAATSKELQKGLSRILSERCDLTLHEGKWVPREIRNCI